MSESGSESAQKLRAPASLSLIEGRKRLKRQILVVGKAKRLTHLDCTKKCSGVSFAVVVPLDRVFVSAIGETMSGEGGKGGGGGETAKTGAISVGEGVGVASPRSIPLTPPPSFLPSYCFDIFRPSPLPPSLLLLLS